MRRLTSASFFVFFLIALFLFSPGGAQAQTRTSRAPGFHIQEEDGDPNKRFRRLKVTNGTLTDNGDGSGSLNTGGGGGGGDNVTVNGTAVDTTANFTDAGEIAWTLIDGGAGGPDDITGAIDATHSGSAHHVAVTVTDSTTVDLTLVGQDIEADSLLKAGTSLTLTGATFDVDDDFIKLGGDIATAGTYDFSGTNFILPTGTVDFALGSAGEVHVNQTDDQVSFHMGATGEVVGEGSLSLIRHFAVTFDPTGWYDQETTYRVLPLMNIGDDAPEGISITEWRVEYVGGDPTTELDCDLMYDTDPDFNPADNATVMDVLDTINGSSAADTGFDGTTAPNGSNLYMRIGADPTDANEAVTFDLWFYQNED